MNLTSNFYKVTVHHKTVQFNQRFAATAFDAAAAPPSSEADTVTHHPRFLEYLLKKYTFA